MKIDVPFLRVVLHGPIPSQGYHSPIHDCNISIRTSSDEINQSLTKFFSLIINRTPPFSNSMHQ